MKRIFVFFSMMTMLATGAKAQTARYDIVPLPRTIAVQQAPGFVLSEKTAVVYADGLEKEARFLSEYVEEMTQMKLSVRPFAKKSDTRGNITLSIAAPDKKKVVAEPNEEAYTIEVTAKGVAISGQTAAAVFRGIQTLRKSLPIVEETAQVVLPAVKIADEPRFGYRGMHLDCSRHFFPVEFVKRYIDLIALYPDRIVIHDYKTDAMIRPEIEKEYILQLSVYAQAASSYYNLPARCVIDYVSLGETKEFEPVDMSIITERVLKVRNDGRDVKKE